MVKTNEHYTFIQHDGQTAVHTDHTAYNADIKRRIEEMRKNNQTLHIGEKFEKSDDECYREIADACNNFLRTHGGEKEELQLADTLEKYNLQLYCYPHTEMSDDKSVVARMAFDGHIKKGKLSWLMRDMVSNPQKHFHHKPEDYDLSGTVWEVFKQIPEFAALEDKIKKALATYGIPTQNEAYTVKDINKEGKPFDRNLNINNLTARDFCFMLIEQTRGSNDMSTKVLKEGYKARHTRRFINENEQEFRAGLMAMDGVRKDYVDALVAAMKRGLTDLTKLPGYKKEWDNQPVVDVHHIVNVKDVNSLEESGKSFADVNRYENMCFIVRHPSHDAMHALETDLAKIGYNGEPISRNDIFYNRKIDRKFIYRIQPPEGVRCMFGLNSVIYDKKYLGLDENTQTNLPDTVKKENAVQKADSGNEKAKEESIRRSHNSKYHARNRGPWNLKDSRRESNRIGRETINDRLNQHH
ncbi:MAG: hypothetical protein J6N49_06730 [Alphaproteobacteria bacterium]|nr:hypothetical protein [Alphaproteobacteria bacterium]